jgi:hypothetical protein
MIRHAALLACSLLVGFGLLERAHAEEVDAARECTRQDNRDHEHGEKDAHRKTTRYEYSIRFIDLDRDNLLAPLDRAQRSFAAKQIAALRKRSSTVVDPNDRFLGISFDLSVDGDFASLTAETSLNRHPPTLFAGWLLHVPSGRILSFRDLFDDAPFAAAMVEAKVRPPIVDRLERYAVKEGSEAEQAVRAATIRERVERATARSTSADWQFSLSPYDLCEPALRVTFGDADPLWTLSERIEIPLRYSGLRPLLKDNYKDALRSFPRSIVRQPFSDEQRAQLLPDLLVEAASNRLPLAELQPDVVDCSGDDPNELADAPATWRESWVFNGPYSWTYASKGVGTCVVVLSPTSRSLSRDEAWAFLSAAKRSLPLDESRVDPAELSAHATYLRQTLGGWPTFEHGTIDGIDYACRFAGVDPILRPLDEWQHAYAKKILASIPKAISDEHPIRLEIDFSGGGRTEELAILDAEAQWRFADGHWKTAGNESRILHVPSQRLLTFDDLFVDPHAVRKHIGDEYPREMPGGVVFPGVDSEVQTRELVASYRRAVAHATAPVPENFRHVVFRNDSQGGFVIYFPADDIEQKYRELMLPGSASFKWLRPHLKPAYRYALEPGLPLAR